MGKFDFIDDKECIPLVEYFNKHGLPTMMCCSGENNHGFGLFYIYFSRGVGQKEIEYFMANHTNPITKHCSTFGWFCQRIMWKPDTLWCYVARAAERAMKDLRYFIKCDKENEDEE